MPVLRYADLKATSGMAGQEAEVSRKDAGVAVRAAGAAPLRQGRGGLPGLPGSTAALGSRGVVLTLCSALGRHIQGLCPDPGSQYWRVH